MTILFIGTYKDKPTTGGHLYHKKMIEAIEEEGHRTALVSYNRLPEAFKCRILSSIYAVFLLLVKRPSLVIQVSDTAFRYILFSMLVMGFNLPLVIMVHHLEHRKTYGLFKSRMRELCIKFNFYISRQIIANSENTRNHIIEISGRRIARKIVIINPGVGKKSRRESARIYSDKKSWTLISVGAVIERKGYYFLIEAIDGIEAYVNRCYIVGKIEEESHFKLLKQKIKALNLTTKIEFTGFTTEKHLRELYERSDVFVLPSLHEGYGIVLCEALCQALPVIASNVGAVPEIIEDGKTGILVRAASGDALRDALNALFASPELAEELSMNALSRCGELQSWDEMKSAIKELLRGRSNGR